MKKLQHQSYSELLVVCCQLGEADAYAKLVALWHQRFFLYALNRLGDREAAKDVTQDCLISISRSIDKLADPAAFPKWSFRILERRCIDWLRKTIRQRELLVAQQLEAEQSITATDQLESTLTVGQLLRQLPPELAATVRLYYLESLSVNEIAEISDVPPGTIKSRLFYARKMLSKLMDSST